MQHSKEVIKQFCLDFFKYQLCDPNLEDMIEVLTDEYSSVSLPVSLLVTVQHQHFFTEKDFHFNLHISKNSFYLRVWVLNAADGSIVCFLYREDNGAVVAQNGELAAVEAWIVRHFRGLRDYCSVNI